MKCYINKQEKLDRTNECFIYESISQETIDNCLKNNDFDRIISRDLMIVSDDNEIYHLDVYEPKPSLDHLQDDRAIEQRKRFLPVTTTTKTRDYCEVPKEFMIGFLSYLNNGEKNEDMHQRYSKIISVIKNID